MEVKNPRESNSQKAVGKRGFKLFKSSVASLSFAIALGVMVLPLLFETSYSSSATTNSTIPPPSFPSSALVGIKIPPNCYPSRLTPRSEASIALSPAPQNGKGKLDNDSASNNPDGNPHTKVDAGGGIHASNDHDTDHHSSNDHGHYVILFGGKGLLGPLNDTWSWNGQTWTLLHPVNSPPARYGASLVYDRQTRSDILFGGMGVGGPLNDTWSWNGTDWQQLHPTTSPPARYDASASYAPGPHGKSGDHGKGTGNDKSNAAKPIIHANIFGNGNGNGHDIVLFGGDSTTGALNDTWSWNGQTWTELHPVTSPSALSGTASTYDPATEQAIFVGGSDTTSYSPDTWSWNGKDWTEIAQGATAPSAPGDVMAAGEDHEITGTFSAPTQTNGSPVIAYVAVAEPGGIYGVTSGCNPPTGFTITGLKNGTSYVVYVYALSEAGVSSASTPSSSVIPFGKPYPPTNLSATPGNGSATITWDAPYDNGSPITSYTITASPGEDTETVTQTAATLSNLEDGVTYAVTATATNAAGTSSPSLPVTVTPEGTPSLPGTPSNLEAYPAKNAATITWSPPPGNGSPVSSYTLTATPVTAAMVSADTATVTPAIAKDSSPLLHHSHMSNKAVSHASTSTTTVTQPNSSQPKPCIVWWKSTCELYNSLSDPTQTGDPVSTWTLVHESKLQGSTIMTITCPSSSECIAVGYVQSTTPEVISPVVWRTTDAGATWTQEQLSSSSGSYIELDAISCSSTADCVTVGGNGIGAGIESSSSGPTAIFATTDGGITWTQEPVPVDVVDVSGISCPSTTTCYASGTYMTSSSGARPVIIESTNAGSSWSIVYLPSVVYGWLSRISCTSTTTCTAVGIQATIDYSTTPIQEQIGGYSITTSNAGASWSSSLIASGSYNPPTGTAAAVPMPMDISCTTPSNCTTDGFTMYVSVTSSGAIISTITPFSYETTNQAQSWTKSVFPSLPSGTSGGLLGISCAGLNCVATGDTIDTSNQISSPLLYQSQDLGVDFVQEYLPTPPTGQTYVLFGAYCFTDGSCYVTGGVGSSSTISYGAIFENTPTELICPPLPVPQLPSGAIPAPPGSKTVVITYNTPYPLSAAVISNLQPGVTYMIEMSAGNSLGEGCAVASVPAVVTIDSSSNCSGCGGPVSQNHSCTLVVFCSNGPVQEHPRVFLIFWGVDSGTVANRIALTNLFSDLSSSGYRDLLGQYGVKKYGGAQGYYYDTTPPGSKSFSAGPTTADNNIAKEIKRVITRGTCSNNWENCWHMSKPSPQSGVGDGGWLNTQFVVVPYAGANISPLLNPMGACAYHSYSNNYIFDFVPDPGTHYEININKITHRTCQYVDEQGYSFGGDFTANLTEYASHEFAEAATDPFSNAWYASNGGEIGDICQYMNSSYQAYVPGSTKVVAQLLWSNRAFSGNGGCVGAEVNGYWQVAANGQVFAFGSAPYLGSISAPLGSAQFPALIADMASTPDGKGYWLVGTNGSVYTFGNARYYGSIPGSGCKIGNAACPTPITSMASTPDGKGYWLLGSNGSVYTYGDATFHGAEGIFTGNYAVSISSTPDGHGYWITDNAGNSYPFGDAPYLGQVGYPGNNQPNSIISSRFEASAYGFWAADELGGVYTNNTRSYNSLANQGTLVSSMSSVFEDQGYYLNTYFGFIYPFGPRAAFFGNAGWICNATTGSTTIEQGLSCILEYSSYPLEAMAVTP